MPDVVRRLALALVLIVVSSIACGPAAPPARPAAPIAAVAPREAPIVPLPPPTFVEPQWKRGAGPPLTLTASDGTGLALTRLAARAVVNTPLAFTELSLSFANPRDRV